MASQGRTDVQSWDKIRLILIEEFDTSPHVFAQVLQFSKKELCTNEGNQPPQNGQEYFERLENKMTELEMLEVLIKVAEKLNLHMDMGTVPLEGVLKGYKEKREAEMEDEEDKHFVGRKKYITDIVKIFEDDRSKYKGVSLCGMGGLGKTSLANQICRKLKGEWRIVKVNLRRVLTLRDMLRHICEELTCQKLVRGEEEDILEQIMEFLRKDNAIERKTILMLDNIEDVMDIEGTSRFLKDFLAKFCNFMGEFGDKCKIRLLLTSRLMLTDHPLLPDTVRRVWKWVKGRDGVYGLIIEKEISRLDSSEAVELFNKSVGENQIDTKQVERIVKLCGYCPIAITILCKSMNHNGLTPESIIEELEPNFWLRYISRTPNVAGCLEKAFESLNRCTQIDLIRLSVFHSASFDIFAAGNVLGTTTSRLECTDKTTEKIIFLKLRSFIEISEDKHMVARYSLHPLVFHLLKSKVHSRPFRKDFQVAEERFLAYFRKVICDVAKTMDKDCREGHRLLGYNRKHVKNFYELIATDDLQKLVISKATDSMTALVESRRIYEIADILLYDDTKWSLIQNVITNTKANEENQLQHFLWCVFEIAFLLDLDRNQEARKKIESLDKLLSTTSRTENPMAAVIGSFFFQRGRYFRKEYDCENAMHYLKLAKERITEVNPDHEDHTILLSKIYNVMGGSEYRKKKPNYQLARTYHESALRILIGYTNRKGFNIEVPEYIQNIGTCVFKVGESLQECGEENEAKENYQKAINWFDMAIRLDIRMKLDRMECHAQTLQNRGEVYCAIESWEKAEDDLKNSITLRERILSPPHRQLTIVLFKTAKLLYKKGVSLYHKGEKDNARESMLWGKELCEKVADLTIKGGLPAKDANYPMVKELTFKLLHTLQDHQALKSIRDKYTKFDKGAFEKQISRARSIGKSHFTQNKRYGRKWREPADKAHCDSESSSVDEVDQNDDGDGDDDCGFLYKMSPREKAVDFTGVTFVGNTRFIRNQNYLFQVALKEPSEEGMDMEDCMSSLIKMMNIDEDDNENGNTSDNTHLNTFTEDGNIQSRNVVECGNRSNYVTGLQDGTMTSMDVDDCVMSDSTKQDVSARVVNVTQKQRKQTLQASGVVNQAPREYNMDTGIVVDDQEQLNKDNKNQISADLPLVQQNVNLVWKEEDTDKDKTELPSSIRNTGKRSLNQEPGDEEGEMVVRNKRRHKPDPLA